MYLVAERICYERGGNVGDDVGYKVMFTTSLNVLGCPLSSVYTSIQPFLKQFCGNLLMNIF